jgi:hypothetical protein
MLEQNPNSEQKDETKFPLSMNNSNTNNKCCAEYIEAIQNLFYVSGQVDECEPELVYKFYLHNTQRKDGNGSYNSIYKKSLETLCGITFKIHLLKFDKDLMLYEVVLINDDYRKKKDVHNCVITIYEEVESVNLDSKETILKPLFNIYSKRDCYKVLEHIYNMRTGVMNVQDPNFITKHKVVIEYLDIIVSNTFEVKGKVV